MKKKIIGLTAVVIIVALSIWNVGLNLNSQNSPNLSDIQLANIEALAQGESTTTIPCFYYPGSTCTYFISFDGHYARVTSYDVYYNDYNGWDWA